MGYSLGIDLGATTCTVALRRGAAVEVCRIGVHDVSMPAVALPRDDGTLVVGEEADVGEGDVGRRSGCRSPPTTRRGRR